MLTIRLPGLLLLLFPLTVLPGCDAGGGTGGERWSKTGALGEARDAHLSTRLPDGRVLLVGGYDGVDGMSSCELYDPAQGTWRLTDPLEVARSHHSISSLPEGEVLAAGGYLAGAQLDSAELFDPLGEVWSPTGPLRMARQDHSATVLIDGRVLVVGGVSGPVGETTILDSGELWDPATGTWSPTGALATARFYHSASLLPDGRVLVAGGEGAAGALQSTEIYDPASETWSPAGTLGGGRHNHAAATLIDGRILLVGGLRGTVESYTYLRSAELFEPRHGTWIETDELNQARALSVAVTLDTGEVLVPGGEQSGGFLRSVELFDAANGTWSLTRELNDARCRYSASVLENGQVLVAGGYRGGTDILIGAELY